MIKCLEPVCSIGAGDCQWTDLFEKLDRDTVVGHTDTDCPTLTIANPVGQNDPWSNYEGQSTWPMLSSQPSGSLGQFTDCLGLLEAGDE